MDQKGPIVGTVSSIAEDPSTANCSSDTDSCEDEKSSISLSVSSFDANDKSAAADHEDDPLQLLVIGAGPHALSLLTRLLDDEPDLMTELERSYVMRRATRYRPRAEVREHLKKRFDQSFQVGYSTSVNDSGLLNNVEKNTDKNIICSATKKNSTSLLGSCIGSKSNTTPKLKSDAGSNYTSNCSTSLNNSNTMVIDTHGRWMAQWESDFEAFGIDYLRSHEHLHPDPFDFQALSVFAEMQKRGNELKPMQDVDRNNCRKEGYYGPFVTQR